MTRIQTLLVSLALLWATPVAAKPVSVSKVASKKPRMFVLAIGVNDYDDDFFPDLRWAERDAERFAAAVGEGTEFDTVRRTIAGKGVTRDVIDSELRRIAAAASGRDVLIVYTSSHGSLVAGSDGDLQPVLVLPTTAAQSLSSTALPMNLLMKWVSRVPARRKFVISAACHSGVGKSRLTADVRERLAQTKGAGPLSVVSEGTVLLSAAARNEVAVEDNKLKADLYTHYMLSALQVFDRNRDGAVSILEAHDYATEMAFKASSGRQRPTIDAEVIGDVDIPLRGRRTKRGLPVLTGYEQAWSGVEVEVNQQPKGRLPFAFPLNSGRNQITLFSQGGGEKIGTFVVKTKDGETVSIEELLAGHPFAAGFYLGQMQPARRAYATLTNGTALATGFIGRYRRGAVELGLDLRAPQTSDADVAPGLAATITSYTAALKPGLRLVNAGPWSLSGDLAIGYEAVALTVKDRETDFSLSKHSGAVWFGAGLSMNWNLLDLMLVSAGLSFENAQHDFDRLGTLDARRRLLTLGIRFTFGGKARRQ